MLTDLELRQAIVALDVIDQQGHPDVLAAIVREAIESTPSADLLGNATPGQQIAGALLANRLAGLVGVSPERCEQAAAAVFGAATGPSGL